jgi:uncharacterized phiE125 gp8 family phage protein
MIPQLLLTVLATPTPTPTPTPTGFLSLDELKLHLRVEHDADDALIIGLRSSALAYIERLTGLVLAERTETFLFDCFGPSLTLPLRPVNSPSIAISYLDPAGAAQTFAAIRTIVKNGFTRIFPAIGSCWPVPARGEGVITVTATVGADSADDDVGLAAKLLIGHWYENREATVVGTIASRTELAVEELLSAHRSFTFH